MISPNMPPLVIYYQQKDLDSPTGRASSVSRPLVKRSTTAARTVTATAKLPSTLMPPPIRIPAMASPTRSSVGKTATASAQPVGETTLYAFYPDSPEAKELFTKRAVTAEERYRLLEARDKIIRASELSVWIILAYVISPIIWR